MLRLDKPLSVFGGMTLEKFFADYWQQQLLFVPKALTHFQDPLTAEDLAGLACEEGISATLSERKVDQNTLQQGPFIEQIFLDLPEVGWSLSVDNIEKYYPSIKAILRPFSFFEAWRFDGIEGVYLAADTQNSTQYAQEDVFIFQGQGTTRCTLFVLETEEISDEEITSITLDQLPLTPVEDEISLQKGDLLYLPAGSFYRFQSHSVAAQQWNVYLRRPKVSEMVQDFSEMMSEVTQSWEFTESQTTEISHPAEISDHTIENALEFMQSVFTMDHDLIGDWWGRYFTQYRLGETPEVLDEPYTQLELQELFNGADIDVERYPGACFLYRQTIDSVLFYAGGQCMELDKSLIFMVKFLCDNDVFSANKLASYMKNAQAAEFITDLFNRGELYCFTEAHDDHDHEH